jgi:hypothetical protein
LTTPETENSKKMSMKGLLPVKDGKKKKGKGLEGFQEGFQEEDNVTDFEV